MFERVVNASGSSILTVGMILAAINILEATFITPQGKKTRLVFNAVFNFIIGLLFVGISLVAPMLSGMKFIINLASIGLTVVYALYTLIATIFKLRKVGENKVDAFFQVFMLAVCMFVLFYVLFVILRKNDFIKYYDPATGKFISVQGAVTTQHTYLTEIPKLPSNNLFLGAAIIFSLIAGVGCFVVCLLNMFKTDKSACAIFVCAVLMCAFFALPAYQATLIKATDLMIKPDYPEVISISGIALIFGLQSGVGLNLPLLIVPILFVCALIASMADRAKAEQTRKSKNVKAVFFILTGISLFLTYLFSKTAMSAELLAKIDAVQAFSDKWSFKPESGTPFELATVGVSGWVMLSALGMIVLSALSIFKDFVYYMIKNRFFMLSLVGIGMFLLFTFSPVIEIQNLGSLTGRDVMFGLAGRSTISILAILIMVTMIIAVLFGLIAQIRYTAPFTDENDWRRWEPVRPVVYENGKWKKGGAFAKLSGLLMLASGILMLLSSSFVISSLTPKALTILKINNSLGLEPIWGDALYIAGIISIVSAIVIMIDWFMGILRVLWAIASKFCAKYILGIICGGAGLGVLYLLISNGSIVESKNNKLVASDNLMDILTGQASTGAGKVLSMILLAVVALSALAALTLIIGDLLRGKVRGVFKGIGSISLLTAGSILIVTEFIYASFVTAGTV
ncbi:MAG: hypothetical protein J6V68_04195, partial [Clostridia bacterium]|nr:hypothetical protein [Clostridia bacterium]